METTFIENTSTHSPRFEFEEAAEIREQVTISRDVRVGGIAALQQSQKTVEQADRQWHQADECRH